MKIMELVAPLVGAWIEITYFVNIRIIGYVAPLVGAWIEIYGIDLKSTLLIVAPLVGAWIEIPLLPLVHLSALRRSSRGSVD